MREVCPLTLIVLALAWLFAVLCVILILRAAALGDRDNAERFAEMRAAGADEPRPGARAAEEARPGKVAAGKAPRPGAAVAAEAVEERRPDEVAAGDESRPRTAVASRRRRVGIRIGPPV